MESNMDTTRELLLMLAEGILEESILRSELDKRDLYITELESNIYAMEESIAHLTDIEDQF
tara:strand:- start:1876 stop:2058 length:183 start_codon:yes stop_codon:yes gene_type:complete